MRELMRRLRARLALLAGRARREEMAARYEEETRLHLELAIERNLAAGMSPGAARRAALIAFGGRDRFAEAAGDEVRSRRLDELFRDVRFSFRALRRAPAFAAAAILTLALGIGATTVIFTVTDHVVLRPLRYPDAARLVLLREVVEEIRDEMPSLPANAGHYLEWRERCGSCAAVAAVLPTERTLRGEGEPQRVNVARASANLLPMLGARAQVGRLFAESEDAEGAPRVVVLTDGFWRRQFGARADIIGQAIALGGEPATVVGVLEPGFALPKAGEIGWPLASSGEMEIIVPLALTQYERQSPGSFNYSVIARLAPGATVERTQAELERIAADFTARHPDGMTFHSQVVPLQSHMVGAAGRALVLLLAAVGALLAIVCVNLANLLLARNAVRLQESAIRIALGAGRGRLVRQALTESVVLALLGGALGVLVSRWGLATLLHFAPASLPRIGEIALDARVLIVSLLVSVTAGLVFGVLPALRFGHTRPGEVLKGQGGRTATEGRRARRARDILVAAQVGLSALLLVATGLLLASFVRVLRVDRGFSEERVLAVDVSLAGSDFPEAPLRAQFYAQALERLGALPGAREAAVASALPLEGDVQADVLSLENDPRPAGERPLGGIRWVSPEYFATLGTPLRAGRIFTSADRGRPVVVLSERAAKALWGAEDPLGRRLWPGSNDTLSEVIGVVADVRTSSLEREGNPLAYIPYWQNPPPVGTLLVRTTSDPAALIPSVRAELRALGPTVPLTRFRTLEEVVATALANRRFQLFVLALFAITALTTASIGIYGVVTQSLRRRTPELGVRMALGARPGDVQRLVLREGLTPVFVGLAVGLAASIALGGAVRALLFDVAPGDPVTLGTVTTVLVSVAAVACWIPARRAAGMDLVRALRED